MRLRHFYRTDHKKQPIPGSNIKRKSKPGNQWKEIIKLCCDAPEIDCTCGPRYFVQLDANKHPVPGTLIRRNQWPIMEQGINYQEIDWKSPCCAEINWTFTNGVGGGFVTFEIYDNGNLVVHEEADELGLANALGNFRPSQSDSEIRILVTNLGCNLDTTINISGGHIHFDNFVTSVSPVLDYTFTFNNVNTSIFFSYFCVVT